MSGIEASPEDRAAIEAVLDRQTRAWEAGDADAFSADVEEDVAFTNVMGMFIVGREGFRAQHHRIFTTFYRGSTMVQEVVRLALIRPDVAIVDTLTRLEGYGALPPGLHTGDGPIRTRLEQVMAKGPDGWRVAAFHNVTVNPAAPPAPPA